MASPRFRLPVRRKCRSPDERCFVKSSGGTVVKRSEFIVAFAGTLVVLERN